MKSVIVLLIFMITGGIAYAQSCSATWALTSNGDCVGEGSITGNPVTRANPVPVPTISYTSNGAGSNSWNVATLTTDRYYEYVLTAMSNVTITNLSLVMQVNYTGMHASIRYSTDNFASYPTLLDDLAFGSSNPYTYTNSSLSVTLTSGQILKIRVYGWNANNINRIFYNRDLVIYGNRETTATDDFRTIALGNWDQTSIWQSSLDGMNWVNSSLIPNATSNIITIAHSVTITTPTSCGNLNFAGGSINLGNNNLTINGTLSGSPSFIYSGIGIPSQTGTNSNITLMIMNPLSLPAVMNSLTIRPGSGNSVILPNNINVGYLTFTNGSITLGNHSIMINSNIIGASLFIYNGSGGLSGTGALNSNIVLAMNSAAQIPPEVNAIDVNPGTGNSAMLPNDVTTTILTFTSGTLSFNNHSLTLADTDFSLTGSQSVSDIFVDLYNISHVYEGNHSIEHTWETSGNVNGTVDLTFSYPASMTTAPKVDVYRRNHLDGESLWTRITRCNTVNHGSYYSVTVHGIDTLQNTNAVDYDWTIADIEQTLPVELGSFAATFTTEGNITLYWTTYSETDVLGYHVFRNTENIVSSANCLTQSLIPANNTSYTQHYSFTDDEVGTDHVTYYYWLQYTEFSGQTILSSPISIEVNQSVTPSVPALSTSIQNVYPNPFVNSATIQYGLKTDDQVEMNIFNIKGQLVKRLINIGKIAGTYDVRWDGKDTNGNVCSSGVYYIEMHTGSSHMLRKILKL
ncbi:MAG TPA: FlgD immunoglobulin-like domain containing protein [Candidatus Cloacimonadota bacterium]|nr:FlgD immunoglobulin-like domain containing protein [Candidatus Cloacimonadota bacterium]